MAHDLHVVRSSDFVRLDAHGKLDFDESRRALAEVARTCIARGLSQALVDVRDLTPSLKLSELYLLVRAFHEMGFQRSHRVAMLHKYSVTERAEFFTMCAKDRGFDVAAFETYEEAIEWLNRPRVELKIPIK